MQYRFDRLLEELGVSGDGAGFPTRMKISWPQGKLLYRRGKRTAGRPERKVYALPGNQRRCPCPATAAAQQRSGQRFRPHLYIRGAGCGQASGGLLRCLLCGIAGHQREETVMVGDSLTSDIKGGKAAGMRTVWYCPKGQRRPAQNRWQRYRIRLSRRWEN